MPDKIEKEIIGNRWVRRNRKTGTLFLVKEGRRVGIQLTQKKRDLHFEGKSIGPEEQLLLQRLQHIASYGKGPSRANGGKKRRQCATRTRPR